MPRSWNYRSVLFNCDRRRHNVGMGLVLLGYRGCGKTSVGRLLAERLGRPFVDTDQELVCRAGITIREIFETEGESAFRDRETAVLIDLLRESGNILALGGGAVLRPQNREALLSSGHDRVYLRCDADTLHARIHADPATAHTRPALTHLGGSVDEVRHLLAMREPLYRAVMTNELDVSRLTVEQVVEQLLNK